ncbi:MAG: hypothetical protein CM15mP103_08650 [Gammaproteobacteria bacterium]|nr:MAG: hypothetical protein CM15mP103_08650 [Gammaproteobacteria bacterium]
MSYQAVPIQDRVNIDNLFSTHAYTLDDGDANGWIALYTEDGVFDVPGLNRFEGPEGLRAIADIVIEGSQGNWRHMATNVLVTPGGAATGRRALGTLVTDWNVDPAGTQFNDYRGTLVRINVTGASKNSLPHPRKYRLRRYSQTSPALPSEPRRSF